MPLLFSYGTLQQDDVQLSTFGRRLEGQPDELPGYEPSRVKIKDAAFAARSGTTHHANVTFNGNQGSRVAGTVFEVSDAELAAADAFEAPFGYRRVSAALASGQWAWVYVHLDAPSPSTALREQFGEIDIYIFDQMLRGRFDGRRRVLDAGCGDGRNVIYLLRAGFDVLGIDRTADAVARVRTVAATLAPQLPGDNFRAGEIDALPWPDAHVDAVVCSAVLHFASDPNHFGRMLQEMWRVLRPGGVFFARLASTIGLEVPVTLEANRRARLPDGSDRFLVDEAFLRDWERRLDAERIDPLKTTNVQNQRCMTTWVLEKRRA
jgi:SAM-dependent methyltransferase